MSLKRFNNAAPTSGAACNVTAADIAFELTTQLDSQFYDVCILTVNGTTSFSKSRSTATSIPAQRPMPT